MNARKRKTPVSESADIAEMQDQSLQIEWPQVTTGSHLTVRTFEDGRTELVWDDEALMRDVQAALASVETPVEVKPKKTRKTK